MATVVSRRHAQLIARDRVVARVNASRETDLFGERSEAASGGELGRSEGLGPVNAVDRQKMTFDAALIGRGVAHSVMEAGTGGDLGHVGVVVPVVKAGEVGLRRKRCRYDEQTLCREIAQVAALPLATFARASARSTL
jgi:hypothetical protein